MAEKFTKWVGMWGNAMSISENRPESYGKDITLRYEIFCPFSGSKIRLTFDNYCGTDSISIEKTVVLYKDSFYPVSFSGSAKAVIPAGANIVSDQLPVEIEEGTSLTVSFYLKDCTQLRSSVYVQGPLWNGKFSVGDATMAASLDINKSRKTNICYFLSDISILTEEKNSALVCYGDSITAQDWPDYLQLLLRENCIKNISVIRKATSGSRILRQYSCITYESYGLMGKNRFNHELVVDGADTVIIQQGINDIIHPVGTEINPFRPMSDLPTWQEMAEGFDWYITRARKMNLKVFAGTLLPIEGWRTYADFREVLKNDFNSYLRTKASVDGVIDFAKAVEDRKNSRAFAPECDSGDHLHPSSEGYKKMALAALEILRQAKQFL